MTHGSRRLSSDPVQGILQLPPSPSTWKQLQAFLELTGYCRIWIPNYGLIAQPLYESLKGQDDSIPLMWGTPQKKAEATLKQALTQAPALRLRDPVKAFQLYVHEREWIALGLLTQRLGPEPQPVASLSKRLDPTTRGWPPCLWNLAVVLRNQAMEENRRGHSIHLWLLGDLRYLFRTTNGCHSNEQSQNLVSGDKISQDSSKEPTQLGRDCTPKQTGDRSSDS